MEDLFGLVVCGGQSSRMGMDKSLINYHGRPQRYYLYEMLKPLCERVFISCNKVQAAGIFPNYELIVDDEKYSGIGPMAALLTAFEKFPSASFLVVGCDYPFLGRKNLMDLVDGRMGMEQAVCYYNSRAEMEEPMLSVYEKECYPTLLENFKAGKYSLRHFLKETTTCLVVPDSIDFLKSVDDETAHQKAKELILANLN